MIERIELGSAPADEDCAQTIDKETYVERANKECRVYIRQLWRVLGELGVTQDDAPESFNLVVKRNSGHDFGDYYEVAVRFDNADEKAVSLAIQVENNIPLKWDEDAKRELQT